MSAPDARPPSADDVRCFKRGCDRGAVTWELDTTDFIPCPNAVCIEHAMRPDLRGTILLPTVLR